MDKYIGRLLDNRYEILEIIGTGGMAVVYKARCHRLNRLVAIKILKDDYLEDEEFRRRFHAESQAVAMLGHPNIVAVYDVSTSIMADYIVMELIEGITLKQYMEKKGVLNWKETLHFAIQIAKALEHAHSRGIVHRDIKPHNVMVLKNGSVKVADFGIARMMSKGNTLTKEALGSVHYISPEQAKGGRVDSRSDIYSLGVVMYEMMTGRPPYDAESPVSVAIQHINGGAVMPSTLNPNIPGGLEQIIMKAMALSIDQRYSSATAMLSDMDEFRKDPAMLFDYNIGPLDDVTRLPKPAPVRENPIPITTAERVASRNTGVQRRTGTGAGTGTGRRTQQPPAAQKGKTPPKRKQSAEAERRNNVATIAIVSCSLVMVVAIIIFLAVLLGGGISGQKPELSAVPQLVGKQFNTLGKTYGDFQIRLGESIYDEKIPEGEIISHKPAYGETVAKGTEIFVTISRGPAPETRPEPEKMKDLIGLSEADAKAALNQMDLQLRIAVSPEDSETVPVGCVIRTKPAAEAELIVGQQVQLWISTGPKVKTGSMPNVVGDRKENAVKTLDSQGLNLTLEYEEVYHKSIRAGFVIETDPVYGTKLTSGDRVTLTISLGPEMESMPNVVGMDINTAVKLLTDIGFETPNIVYVESNTDKDTVVSQSHDKNVKIDVDTLITLEISKGPKPAEPTQPKETTEPTEEKQPTGATESTETKQPTQAASVTKDVVIDLKNSAAAGECDVQVTRDGMPVYNGKAAKGTVSVTVTAQTGSGSVIYVVRVSDMDGWSEWEQVEIFTENE